jgi:hypothetical protein
LEFRVVVARFQPTAVHAVVDGQDDARKKAGWWRLGVDWMTDLSVLACACPTASRLITIRSIPTMAKRFIDHPPCHKFAA